MRSVVLSIIIQFVPVTLVHGHADSPQELADTYKELHDKRDIDQIIALYYSKDAASSSVSTINYGLKTEFEDNQKIKEIVINKIDPGELEKIASGIPYGDELLIVPTLDKVTHTMTVVVETEGPYPATIEQEIHMGKTESGYLLSMQKFKRPNEAK